MELGPLLQSFSDRYDLGRVALDEAGACALQIGTDTILSIESSPDRATAFISAPVCRIPPDAERLALFDRLMQVHGFGIATQDAYFAASPTTARVVLFKRLTLDHTDPPAFINAMESFLLVLKQWRDAANSGQLVPAGDGLPERPQSFPMPGQFA